MWTWRYEGVGKEIRSADGRKFILSLAASLAILIGGMIWTMRIGQDCNRIYHHLAHSKEELNGLRLVVAFGDNGKGRAQ